MGANDGFLHVVGMPNSIRVEGMCSSVYIDGQEFINRLNEAVDRLNPAPENKRELFAKDFACAMLSNNGLNYGDNIDAIAVKAFIFADEFLKQSTIK